MATQTYEYNGFNQLTSVASSDGSAATTFWYDGNGNQVRKTDASGLTQYVYNQDNRLAGIGLPNGGSNAFEYDANGLRTKKTDSSGTTRYLLDGLSVIAQYAPDGARQAWYTQSLARIDEVLSVVNGQGKYWYQADALGSTYALADNAGNVTARGGYDVFGAPVAVSGSVGQPFGFTGREHDLDSGLVYARARYLNVAAARWDRADPMGFVDGTNVYSYVNENPARFVDPTGKFLILPVVVGAALGAVFAAWSGSAAGLHGWPLLQVAMTGAAIGALAAIATIPGMAVELSALITGGFLAGISNALGQLITMNVDPRATFSWTSLLLSVIGGAMSGLFGGAFMPGSKLYRWVMDGVIPGLRAQLEAMLTYVVLSSLGGFGDVMVGYFTRLIAYDQATSDDGQQLMCIPKP